MRLSSDELKDLVSFVISKIQELYSLRNESADCSLPVEIVGTLLDNCVSAGRFDEGQAASYRKLAKILQEEQSQKNHAPVIEESKNRHGYLSLSVDDYSGSNDW